MIVIALGAPLLLLLVELVLPYPSVVEELVKFGIVLIGKKINNTWLEAVVAGLILAVSETAIYLNKILNTGDWSLVGKRIVYTGLLNSVTMSMMFWGAKKNKWLAVITLLISVAIHWSYNQLMTMSVF